MSLCLAIISGKGGTGKSTVSSGLAIALSKMGKKVLLIDLDGGLRCLDLFFGIDSDIVFDLSDILSGRDAEDAIYSVDRYDNISLIPAPAQIGDINSQALAELIESQSSLFDVIILDFPAGIDFNCTDAILDKLQFVTVCNPDPVSVRDASLVFDSLPQGHKPARLILNKFDIQYIKNGIYRNVDDIIDISGMRLLGIIPQDEELMLLGTKRSLKKRGRAFKALTRISGRLCGNEIRMPKPKKI